MEEIWKNNTQIVLENVATGYADIEIPLSQFTGKENDIQAINPIDKFNIDIN